MPKYRVQYDSTRVYTTSVDVDAPTEEEANDLAYELICGEIEVTDPRYQDIEWDHDETLNMDHIQTKEIK